jgi:lipid-A-disaccharide synthase-like uncharacterized protein
MDWLHHLVWPHDRLLGIDWSFWKIVGWTGNAVFSARFLVQWYATEKRKQVVVPLLFWWLSLAGSLLMLAYALVHLRDSVVIFAYAFNWIPYLRNVVIHRRHEKSQIPCPACAALAPPTSRFCGQCGGKLPGDR